MDRWKAFSLELGQTVLTEEVMRGEMITSLTKGPVRL